MKRYLAFILIVTLTIFCFGLNGFCQPEPTPQSLYQRLGSINNIAQVVDDFVNNFFQNEVIKKNPKIAEGLGKLTPAGFKFHICAFIGQSTGGPEKYTGKPMKEAHANLGISEAEWQITVDLLKSSLGKFNILEKEQNELLSIIGATKPDVVTAKEAPPVQAAPQVPQIVPQAPSPPEAQAAPPAEGEARQAPPEEPQLVPLLPSEEAQAAPPAPPPEIKPAFPEPIPPAQAAPKEIQKEESGFPEFADPAP